MLNNERICIVDSSFRRSLDVHRPSRKKCQTVPRHRGNLPHVILNTGQNMTASLTPESAPTSSIASVQSTLSSLQATLSDLCASVSEFAQRQNGPSSADLKPPMKNVLMQTTIVKLSHDSLLHYVGQARQESLEYQKRFVAARQKLLTLRYERGALEREIASERARSRSAFKKVDLNVGKEVDADVDEQIALETHDRVLKLLEGELERRREVKKQTAEVKEKKEEKRRALLTMKERLRNLPEVVRKLGDMVEPVRSLVEVGNGGHVSEREVAEVRALPAALYILGREALGYRGMFEGRISVKVIEEVGNEKRLYRTYPKKIDMQVHGGTEAGGKSLRVLWRYHEELGIMSVEGMVEGMVGEEWLRSLFPFDEGNETPNAGNNHLEGGNFQFDVSKAGGGRPYVWANLVCGIGCLSRFDGEGDVVGAGWAGTAEKMEGHLRFKEVVEALHRRLVSRVILERQLKCLVDRRLMVGAEDLGLEQAESTVEDFVKLAREDWDANHTRFTQVWCMRVENVGVKVNCMIGLLPDYPVGPPVFRLTCHGGGGICEKDVVELEYAVNAFAIEDEQKREFLLSAQIGKVLSGVDILVARRRTDDTETSKEEGSGGAEKQVPASIARLLS